MTERSRATNTPSGGRSCRKTCELESGCAFRRKLVCGLCLGRLAPVFARRADPPGLALEHLAHALGDELPRVAAPGGGRGPRTPGALGVVVRDLDHRGGQGLDVIAGDDPPRLAVLDDRSRP